MGQICPSKPKGLLCLTNIDFCFLGADPSSGGKFDIGQDPSGGFSLIAYACAHE